MLTADLVSRSLDFDDLAAVIGGAPDVGPGETASPEQVALARRMRGRLLPDTPLDVQRLRAMDADVDFRATSVRTKRIPLRQVAFHVDLDNGLLLVDPMSFDFPRGRIAGMVRLNGRGATPVTDVDLRAHRPGPGAHRPARARLGPGDRHAASAAPSCTASAIRCAAPPPPPTARSASPCRAARSARPSPS